MTAQFAYWPAGPAGVPPAFALPWDVFAAAPQPLHVSVNDGGGHANLVLIFGAEGVNTQYVWNTAYVSTDGLTWTAQALSGGAQVNGWFQNHAQLTVVSSTGQYGVVGTPGVWTYVAYLLVSAQPNGMRNAIGALLPLKWQVQAFSRGPLPIVTVNPAMPNISDTTPLGATVAIISVVMDDGTPWTGTLSLSTNPNGIFALSGNSIIVNPAGPGVGPNAATQLDTIVVVATQ
jgi:hypothetical protein